MGWLIQLLISVAGEIDHSVYNIMTYNEQVLRSTAAAVLIRKFIVHLYEYVFIDYMSRAMCTDNESSTSGCQVLLLLVFLTSDLLFFSEVKLL